MVPRLLFESLLGFLKLELLGCGFLHCDVLGAAFEEVCGFEACGVAAVAARWLLPGEGHAGPVTVGDGVALVTGPALVAKVVRNEVAEGFDLAVERVLEELVDAASLLFVCEGVADVVDLDLVGDELS